MVIKHIVDLTSPFTGNLNGTLCVCSEELGAELIAKGYAERVEIEPDDSMPRVCTDSEIKAGTHLKN